MANQIHKGYLQVRQQTGQPRKIPIHMDCSMMSQIHMGCRLGHQMDCSMKILIRMGYLTMSQIHKDCLNRMGWWVHRSHKDCQLEIPSRMGCHRTKLARLDIAAWTGRYKGLILDNSFFK
jgi:hypothetical protein